MSEWKDCGNYLLHDSPQGSSAWHEVRKRLTGSKFGTAAGDNPYETPEDFSQELRGNKKPFTKKQIENMNHGTQFEPIARSWYETRYHYQVESAGFAVPKWDMRIWGSVDGLVKGTNGIIEIKCPQKMYDSILEHLSFLEEGHQYPERYYDHIPPYQYDQMLGYMRIMEKEWCDYIVFCTYSDLVFIQRIYYDSRQWEDLYQRLNLFMSSLPDIFPSEPVICTK
jgi:putative phage-type endonuclease